MSAFREQCWGPPPGNVRQVCSSRSATRRNFWLKMSCCALKCSPPPHMFSSCLNPNHQNCHQGAYTPGMRQWQGYIKNATDPSGYSHYLGMFFGMAQAVPLPNVSFADCKAHCDANKTGCGGFCFESNDPSPPSPTTLLDKCYVKEKAQKNRMDLSNSNYCTGDSSPSDCPYNFYRYVSGSLSAAPLSAVYTCSPTHFSTRSLTAHAVLLRTPLARQRPGSLATSPAGGAACSRTSPTRSRSSARAACTCPTRRTRRCARVPADLLTRTVSAGLLIALVVAPASLTDHRVRGACHSRHTLSPVTFVTLQCWKSATSRTPPKIAVTFPPGRSFPAP